MNLAISRRGFVAGLAALSAGALNSRALSLLRTFSQDAENQLHRSEQSAPARGQSSESPIVFKNVIDESGIKFVLKNSVSPQRYSIETMTGGVAVFDYNNDGLLDIFFTNGAGIPSLNKSDPSFYNRLFRNNGDGTFTDVTEKAGLAGIGYSMGVAAGDYDNDGFVDLYVAGFNRNQLLHNNGDGTFTDATEKAGVSGSVPRKGKPWSVTAGWIDYNNDGLLDLFVVNYLDYSISIAHSCQTDNIVDYCSPNEYRGTPNILYKNNGDGTFTDVSQRSHISKYVGKGMGVAFADYDDDGFTDIFVSNDTFPNFLLHNNGDGTFTDVALLAGVAYNENGKTVAGMGTDFRDIDNDGKPDIFHAAMYGVVSTALSGVGGLRRRKRPSAPVLRGAGRRPTDRAGGTAIRAVLLIAGVLRISAQVGRRRFLGARVARRDHRVVRGCTGGHIPPRGLRPRSSTPALSLSLGPVFARP